MAITQHELDRENAAFWSELCGSGLARSLGITGREPDALRRFDDAYFAYYPYLKSYVDRFDLADEDVLEIGLGYGTLGQYIAERGARYFGLDLAGAPVEMMRHRLRMLGDPADDRVVAGSALDAPFPSAAFDYVYSIGCLHHTGDLARACREVHRVLRPGGTAVLMVYNRHSWRQLWQVDRRRIAAAVGLGRAPGDAKRRRRYDRNAAGAAAPHTDFTSRTDVRLLLGDFDDVRVRAENFDPIRFRRTTLVSRERLLTGPLPRLLGLDLYVVARKAG
ncbi:MAG TPA: class I SAM-dependent methyltransferase [Gaiellaceae bacterium]|nr:class I SAM-dependent methyltransferase [Gaiellaceae bacterium]